MVLHREVSFGHIKICSCGKKVIVSGSFSLSNKSEWINQKDLQTIAIATGTSLGAIVLILVVVVLVVCRLRVEKAKEAEQLRMAESSSFQNGFDGSFLSQAYLHDRSNGFGANGNEGLGHGAFIPRARSNDPNPSHEDDRRRDRFILGYHRSSSNPKHHGSEPLPDYNGVRGRGSDRLNMSHDSGLLTSSTNNGSLDRNRYRGRGSSDLQYGSLNWGLNRQRDIRL